MKLYFILLAIVFSLNSWSDTCSLYDVKVIQNSDELAETMGKARIFDVDLMMKYDDGAKIPTGEVVLVEHKFFKSQVLVGGVDSKGEYFYTLNDGTRFNYHNSKEGRVIASLVKQQIKICQ